MVASMLGKPPTCLSCLRRLASSGSNEGLSRAFPVQVRGKQMAKFKDYSGVVVRLLEDIPRFGPKDAILRVPRGRMRNMWFPSKKAEYVAVARMKELGLTRRTVAERDPSYGVTSPLDKKEKKTVADVHDGDDVTPTIAVQHVSSGRARTLLTALIPDTLTFKRNANPALSSPTSLSNQPRLPVAEDPAEKQQEPVQGAIFSSVSTTDIANTIRELMAADPEGSRISLDPRDIRFVTEDDGVDRVKSLGRWEIDITPGGSASALRKDVVELVRKSIEVVAAEK